MKNIYKGKKGKYSLVAAIATWVSMLTLSAVTWDDGGGNTNWTTCANWACDTAPACGADVCFTACGTTSTVNSCWTVGTVTFGTACDFQIKNSGGSVLSVNCGIDATVACVEYTVSSDVALGACNTWTTVANGMLIVSGDISGASGITFDGAGTTVINANGNTISGGITIDGGTLVLDRNDTLANDNDFALAGGTLSTGVTAGKSQSDLGTLTLTSNSEISLEAGSHSIYFDDSSSIAWTGDLTIYGWDGSAGASGTHGKVYIGTDASGLTSTQLDMITFDGFGAGATLLATGELVPSASAVPETSTWIGIFGITALVAADFIRRRRNKKSVEA